MGLRDYYRQFEAMDEEEISARLRDEAQERRRLALERVEPLDLRETTWPEYPPHAVVNAITFSARRGLHRYLDPTAGELRSELGTLLGGVDPSRIVVGDGAGQLLAAAAVALMEDDDELITPWPGYALMPVIARVARGHAVPVSGFSPEEILRALTPRTRIVALANPNDPTGELLRRDALRDLLEALPDRVIVLLDEALRDYVDAEERDASLALTESFPRLLVVRTFSKAWGLAGLRCGYAVGGPDAAPLLARIRPPVGAAELALAGVLEAVRHHSALPLHRAGLIRTHRRILLDAIAERPPLTVADSQANVLWVAAEATTGADLGGRLERVGILTRTGTPFGDDRHVRITVPHRMEDVDRLVRALDVATRAT